MSPRQKRLDWTLPLIRKMSPRRDRRSGKGQLQSAIGRQHAARRDLGWGGPRDSSGTGLTDRNLIATDEHLIRDFLLRQTRGSAEIYVDPPLRRPWTDARRRGAHASNRSEDDGRQD
ncbi:hypothetical protein MRX96_026215 [Rhipicephalus microplus]